MTDTMQPPKNDPMPRSPRPQPRLAAFHTPSPAQAGPVDPARRRTTPFSLFAPRPGEPTS